MLQVLHDQVLLANERGNPTTNTTSICVKITQPPDSITDQNLNQNVC